MIKTIISTVKDLKFIFRYRQLIKELVVRELKARYRGSVFGFFWSFLNPLLLLLVYWVVFSIINRFAMENYAVFLFTGLLPWMWFNSSVLEGSNSIIGGGSYVTKALFPPEILPVTVTFSNLVHFILSLPILIAGIFYFKIGFTYALIYFPVLVIIQLLFTLGIVFIVATTSVFFRDMQHIIGHLTTFWFFLTPIIYRLQDILKDLPTKYHKYFFINPMAQLMQGYQHIFFDHQPINWLPLGILAVISIVIFFAGYIIFVHYKDEFPEIV